MAISPKRTSGQKQFGGACHPDAILRGVLPPVLKITQCVLIGLESSLLYMILQGLSRKTLFPETCGSRAFRKGASLEIGSAVHFLLDSSPVM